LGGWNATPVGASNTGSSAFTGIIKVNPMNSIVGSTWGMDRANSAIKIKSASFGGAYAGAMLGLGGKSGSAGANQSTSMMLGWDGMGARVQATATSVNDDSSMAAAVAATPTATTTRKSQQWSLGATYQILPALGAQVGYTANKIDAGFSNQADGATYAQLLPAANYGTLGQKVKLSATTAGVNYMITPTIKATVGFARTNLSGDFINAGSANTYSTILNYYLSKRTDLYAVASNTAVKDGMYSNVGSNTTYNNNGQKVTTTMALGMRHTF
jgi:predicted porin